MTKPALPAWDTDDTHNTNPPATKKATGMLATAPFAQNYFNWLVSRTWRWLRGQQGQYADIVVGTAAQKLLFQATHSTADDWVAAISDGDTVVFRAPITLTQNEVITEDESEVVST
jgi:hypothetical protein